MRKSTLALLVSAALVLAACGGQGTWTGQDDDDGDNPDDTNATLQGAVVKGAVSAAQVCAYALSDGAKGGSLGCAETDSGGNYLLQVPGSGQPVLVEVVSTGQYSDEASGRSVGLDGTLRSAATALPRAAHTLHITPLTELAMRRAAGASGGWSEESINDGMALVARAYDTDDLRTVRPLDPTDTASRSSSARGALNHGLALAGLSQWRASLAGAAGSATVETVLAEAERAFKPDLVTAQTAAFRTALDAWLRGSRNQTAVTPSTIRTQMNLQWDALSGESGALPAVAPEGIGPVAPVPEPVDGPVCVVTVAPRSGSILGQDYKFCVRPVVAASCNAAGMAASLSAAPNFGLVSSLPLVTVNYTSFDSCSGQDANEIIVRP